MTLDEFQTAHQDLMAQDPVKQDAMRRLIEEAKLRAGEAEHRKLMAEEEADLQSRAEEFAPPPPPPPPQLPAYKSGFAEDYDPRDKEKDAGF